MILDNGCDETHLKRVLNCKDFFHDSQASFFKPQKILRIVNYTHHVSLMKRRCYVQTAFNGMHAAILGGESTTYLRGGTS
jgi:hypothetical protein